MAKKKQINKGWQPEPERKFLVISLLPEVLSSTDHSCTFIQQFYLCREFPSIVRVRFICTFDRNGLGQDDDKVLFGIKTRKSPADWRSQQEFEVEIPTESLHLFNLNGASFIKKSRYKIGRFDFDIFLGELTGLKLLEIELSDPDEEVVIPDGFNVIEVTDDLRFRNENLDKIKTNKELKALIASVVEGHKNG